MGRGSGRVKAGGLNLAHDVMWEKQTPSLNLSLHKILKTGFFEKDLVSYCANRLTEYSCTYWLDSNIGPHEDYVDLNINTKEFGDTNKTINNSK